VHLTGGSLAAKKRGFNASAFFGTISIIHARQQVTQTVSWHHLSISSSRKGLNVVNLAPTKETHNHAQACH